MKKLTFSIMSLALAFGASAQTIVSTQPQNRNVVLEEFTGVHCVYCPDGHRRANELAAANPDRVSLINIHQGGFAWDYNDAGQQVWKYTTQWGNALANQYSINSYPNATINRGTSATTDRSQWSPMAQQVLSQTSFVNVAATAEIDIATRQMTIHVEVYYTGDATTPHNFLNIALTQDNVIGNQTGAENFNPTQMTPDGKYRHMHMLRNLITGQWGDTLTEDGTNNISTGTFISKDYTYTIPNQLGTGTDMVNVELEDMHLVVFVARDHKEIYTGVSVTPTFVNIPTEITLVKIGTNVEHIYGCNDLAKPSLKIKNKGATTITSMVINYTGAAQPKQWTGSIPTWGEQNIELDDVHVTMGQTNTINMTIDEVNGVAAQTPYLQGSGSIKKPELVSGQGPAMFILTRDKYGNETTWSLKNSSGTILLQGGPYDTLLAPGTITDTILFNSISTPGCYLFEILDAYGDGINSGYGDGNYKIIDAAGTVLVSSDGKFGTGEKRELNISEMYVGLERISGSIYQTLLYPNPAKNSTTLEIALTEGANANIVVVDMLGREVISLGSRALHADVNKVELNTSDLNNGIYFVRVITENGSSTKKLTIKK